MSETMQILTQARRALIDTVVSENGKRRLAEMFDQAVEQRVRLTDDEYNRIYDKIYIRLKMRGLIIDRGGRDYLDQYADGYMVGVEAALQEVQKLG